MTGVLYNHLSVGRGKPKKGGSTNIFMVFYNIFPPITGGCSEGLGAL